MRLIPLDRRKQSYSRVRLCSRKTLPSVNWPKGHLWFNPKTHWEPIRLICLYVESRKLSWKWENFCDVQNSSSKNWELPLTVKDSEKSTDDVRRFTETQVASSLIGCYWFARKIQKTTKQPINNLHRAKSSVYPSPASAKRTARANKRFFATDN